jgi:hypothetical protein
VLRLNYGETPELVGKAALILQELN